ncbi:MAG TPA: glucosyl-3-phosphoglycerate synthase [Solirubrobacteraceae bacterium]|jgi:glycosyltransferase involved in cell wall biosynthesis|nr:glucosyl-3-phosphoglycerate synthase [Solirubrobacteraceae bacterium]
MIEPPGFHVERAQTALAGLPVPRSDLRVVVVVPARDEESRIAACLRALSDQRDVDSLSYETIVVLDGCRDRTREVVAQTARLVGHSPVHTVTLEQPQGVGHARRLGMDIAYRRLLQVGRENGLIASTDADTAVATDWISAQLALVADGATAIGGLIELDRAEGGALDPHALRVRDRSASRRLAAAIEQTAGAASVEHPHFAGASLALTPAAYRRCGGLPVRAALEDQALAQALARHGIAIHRSSSVRVRTSARTDGRAPRGLAQDLTRADWRARRNYRAEEFRLDRLLALKQQTVALLLPTREVAQTLAPIAQTAARLEQAGLLDEVLVLDAASQDGTVAIAREAGLRVVQESELMPRYGPAQGKGDAMWRGLAATRSEIVVFADTDTEDFNEGFLLGLVGPLLSDPDIQLVKGAFRRPFRSGATVLAEGGGRVTELMARPLLNLHAPELAVFEQPLAGETAARRGLLEQIPFSAGYGVEIAMLIDCWRACGLDALAQVDLGERQNRHQSLRELSAMAYAVLVAAQTRFLGTAFADAHAAGSIVLPPLRAAPELMESRPVTVEERPPLAGDEV